MWESNISRTGNLLINDLIEATDLKDYQLNYSNDVSADTFVTQINCLFRIKKKWINNINILLQNSNKTLNSNFLPYLTIWLRLTINSIEIKLICTSILNQLVLPRVSKSFQVKLSKTTFLWTFVKSLITNMFHLFLLQQTSCYSKLYSPFGEVFSYLFL